MPTTLAELERQKAAVLTGVEGWSPTRLHFRPAGNTWSTSQVLDHLVRVEASIVAATHGGLRAPHRIGVRDRLGTVFLTRIFRSDRRVKVPPSAPQILPEDQPDLDAIRQHWAEVRRDLVGLIEQASPYSARAGVFRHPVAGWMSLSGVLDFLAVHVLHHGFQLERLRSTSLDL